MVKLDTLNPPSCWNYESPEERAEQEVYWSCKITRTNPSTGNGKRWLIVFVSKEDAEASAASGRDSRGVWDGSDARSYTIEFIINAASEHGSFGVRICTWDGEGKVILKEIPV